MPTKKIKLELSFRKKDQSNLLGILSIVFGVVGLFLFGLVFGTVGLICGIIGRKKDENKTLSLIGIIFSSISLFLSILVFFGLIAFFSMLNI
tara:strand:- start:979 stop:1254 length:276 start_codon:yes stop_codon:yes gene_type:complete